MQMAVEMPRVFGWRKWLAVIDIQGVSAQEYLIFWKNKGNSSPGDAREPQALTSDQESLRIERGAGGQRQSFRGGSRAMGMEEAFFGTLKAPAGQQLAP